MPSKDQMHTIVRRLAEAALDQRNPSAELKQALSTYLEATEHRLSAKYQRRHFQIAPEHKVIDLFNALSKSVRSTAA